MMSEEEREIDIESDEDDDEDFDSSYSQSYSNSYGPKEDDEEYDSNQTQSYSSQYYQQGDEDEEYDPRPRQASNPHFYSQAEKRAHHNALERKRRDHIKDSFSNLRDAVALLRNEKVASRAQILKKAAEYIMSMRRRNYVQQTEIEDLKRQNKLLESQINTLANIKSENNTIVKEEVDIDDGNFNDDSEEWSESEESDEENEPVNLPKKIKTEVSYY